MRAPRQPHQPRTRALCATTRPATVASSAAEDGYRLLQSGENMLAIAQLYGWRFEAADVTYEHRTLLLGGPIGFAVSGVVSAIGNHRARQEAERLAAPQWRPLGPLVVVATEERLLVWHNHEFYSVWYQAIVAILRHGEDVELRFHDDPPYLLAGADAVHVETAMRRHRTNDHQDARGRSEEPGP